MDVHNVGKSKGGGSCTAAAFLSEFAPANVPWMHIDIASVMDDADDQPYIDKGGLFLFFNNTLSLLKKI